jgi:predicted nucleic acid-binding protein
MKPVNLVVNASPIIALAKIGCADFLSKISTRLVIPEGVRQEIITHKYQDPATEWLRARKHDAFIPVEVPTIVSDWNLGIGEAQVIAFALQNKNFSAALDDKAAKNCAEVFNISIIGTIAIIIKAKHMGLTPKIEPLLLALIANGFRLTDTIIKTALRSAGEDYGSHA